MSVVALTSHAALQRSSAHSRVVRSAPLVLTRRGRLVITLSVTALLLVLALVLSPWSMAGNPSANDRPSATVVVGPGDTLWGIASDLAEPGEVKEMVIQLQKFNALPDADLMPGQILEVPPL